MRLRPDYLRPPCHSRLSLDTPDNHPHPAHYTPPPPHTPHLSPRPSPLHSSREELGVKARALLSQPRFRYLLDLKPSAAAFDAADEWRLQLPPVAPLKGEDFIKRFGGGDSSSGHNGRAGAAAAGGHCRGRSARVWGGGGGGQGGFKAVEGGRGRGRQGFKKKLICCPGLAWLDLLAWTGAHDRSCAHGFPYLPPLPPCTTLGQFLRCSALPPTCTCLCFRAVLPDVSSTRDLYGRRPTDPSGAALTPPHSATASFTVARPAGAQAGGSHAAAALGRGSGGGPLDYGSLLVPAPVGGDAMVPSMVRFPRHVGQVGRVVACCPYYT